MTSIFISYARKDGRELAANLHQQLETDYDIWQDVVDMPGGENWWEAIRRAIESVDVMILVVTDRALEPSSVVRREWMHARKVGTPILPIAFDADIFSKAPGWLKKRDVFILAPDHPDYDATWVRLRAQLDNPPDRRPVPFMPLPLLQTFTARYAKQDEIKSHILDEYAVNPRFLSVALQGEGGFGKTTLAQAICHDIDVFEAFDGGVLWAEIGENVTNLTEKINAMIRSLTGVQVAYSDEAEAARRLHNELQDRECLLVLDDIWDAAQLQPFLGAITSAYIITTQDDAIASTADEIVIANQMEPREALQVFVNWVPERQRPSVTDDPEQAALSDLAYRLGEWPLLLGIIGFELSAEIERTQSLLNAITFINEGLNEAGLTTFDRNSARDRHAALHATMNYSLRRFGDDEKCRLFELAVFPENVLVPEAVALRLWAETADMRGFKSRNLLRDLNGRFFQMRAQEKGGALFLRFHRTVRLYLAERLGDDWPAIHSQLMKSFNPDNKDWPDVDNSEDGYIYANLSYHLQEAEYGNELHALLTGNDRWMQAQFQATSGNRAFVNDLWMAIACYTDPIEAKEIADLAQLWAVQAQIYSEELLYTNKHLEALVWLNRKDEALNRTLPDESKKEDQRPISFQLFGILAVYRALKEKSRFEGGSTETDLLNECVQIWLTMDDEISWANAALELASELVEFGDWSAFYSILDRFAERYLLIKSVNSLDAQDIRKGYAHMLAKAGKHDEAYVLATSLEDSIHRVKTLCILAIETQTQGNPVKAMQLLQEATEAAQKRSDARDQIEGLCIVARKMAEIGLEENARQLTNQAEGLINQIEVNRRSRTLRDLSETWAFLGNYKNARRSARKITDVYDRDQALIQVVVSVSKLGKFNQAVNLSLEIGDDYRRSNALFEVVMAYAQIGRFDQADRLIGRIPTESVRSQAYCILSKEKAKLGSYLEAQGYFEQANALVRSQTLNIEDRDEVYRFLAVILARHGHQAKALELTEKIETNEVKIKTLCDLAGLFSTISQPSGDAALQSVAVQCLTKARTNILQVEERWTRDDLLVYTIEAYAKIGLFDPVKGLLNQIESEHDKVLGLTTLAREHSLKQDTKSAEQTLREAEEITRALSDRLSKPLDLGVTLSALAAAYVLIDQPSKAQALFDQAQQDIRETEGQYYYHALNLGAYASELAHIGRFEEAIFEAKRIKEDVDAQAKSLLVIAKYAIQQGENEWAHEAIKEISDHRPWGPKHQGAAVLACGLAQVGHFTDAFKVLGSRWVDEYLMALMEWGEAFDKVEDGLSLGVVQSVLQVVGRQRDDYHKIVELLSA